MMNSQTIVEVLSSPHLLSATRTLVHTSRGVELELLLHLAEIDVRKLYLDQPFSSMFAFCVGEYGFSEDAAYADHPRPRRPACACDPGGDPLRARAHDWSAVARTALDPSGCCAVHTT